MYAVSDIVSSTSPSKRTCATVVKKRHSDEPILMARGDGEKEQSADAECTGVCMCMMYDVHQ